MEDQIKTINLRISGMTPAPTVSGVFRVRVLMPGLTISIKMYIEQNASRI
ncbi:MAG TPA: hypothetical protein VN608_09885 [Clostridia bacterium]|nr:hypothetical protein [Clostridia bacterium]